MKSVTIAEFKRTLPVLLDEVANGARIVVQRGRRRENVAILSPYIRSSAQPRRLGVLGKRGKPVFKQWAVTESEFLDPPDA